MGAPRPKCRREQSQILFGRLGGNLMGCLSCSGRANLLAGQLEILVRLNGIEHAALKGEPQEVLPTQQ